MAKYFLLIAGDNYYPGSDTSDWKDTFKTYQEAEDKVKVIRHEELYTKGKKKGQVKSIWYTYEYNGLKYDWYKIIDLREYIDNGS